MGQIYKRIFDRNIEVRLETKLNELVMSEGRVAGVKVSNFGRSYEIKALHGVVVCAGGFEWNQALRERFFPVPGLTDTAVRLKTPIGVKPCSPACRSVPRPSIQSRAGGFRRCTCRCPRYPT